MQSEEAHNTSKAAAESPGETRLSALLKEAKTLRARLKAKRTDAAKKNPAGELDRKSLRNVYLKLLFNYPFSSRTGGVEVDIWTETCHPGVQAFRTGLDLKEKQIKALQSKRAILSSERNTSNINEIYTLQSQEAQLLQSYLRTAKAFRTYLEEEETFWRDLVGRVVRVFNVEEAKPFLRVLGIACDGLGPTNLGDGPNANTGLGRVTGADAEGGNLEVHGRLPANRQRLISVIHKSLMCCGDLSRYRELYKEAQAVEAPSSRQSHRGGKRGGRGGMQPARDLAQHLFKDKRDVGRDYSKAALCYEQARALLPSNGQPSNQIAVLAVYTGQQFTAVYHYYRAMCVTVPFSMTKSNLGALLQRAINEWEAQGRVESTFKPWDDIEKRKLPLLHDLVVLHAYYFLTTQGPAPPTLAQHCHQMLASLLTDKALAADTIVQIVVTAISSLWTRRLWRGGATKVDGASLANVNAEQQILFHLMGVMTVLVQVAYAETKDALEMANRDAPDESSGSDPLFNMARNITAAFRRILPALRIASKWLKSHVDYVQRSKSPPSKADSATQESTQMDETSTKQIEELSAAVDAFWSDYVAFINLIRFAFPFDHLPKLGTLGQSGMTSLDFEEDRDMRGFVPMKKSMLIDAKLSSSIVQEEVNQLHPNEEHLVRIADILIDAKVIAETESSPIAFDDAKNNFFVSFIGKPSQTDSSLAKSSNLVVPASDEYIMSQSQDNNWEGGSESTEDAVDLAMRAVDERRRALGSGTGPDGNANDEGREDDDDDGEIILIPSSSRKAQVARSDVSTASPSGSVAAPVPLKAVPSDEPLTAQHLFLQMLNGGNRPSSKPVSPSPSTPQPHLLFGGISSTNSQGSFGSLAHHGGAWDGNEAVQFMNQQSRSQQHHQGGNALPHPAFVSNSPWDPPSQSRQSADWR
jgi:hypothetical protein